jgi:hypothetical protein
MQRSSGLKGAADAYGVRNIYFYDLQDENSDQFSFRIPNLYGEFIRGWDNGRGVDPDRPFGSVQSDDVGPHRHELKGDQGTQYYVSTQTGYYYDPYYGDYVYLYPRDSGATNMGSTVYSTRGAGNIYTGYVTPDRAALETRPRNVALLPCIKI